MMSREEIENVLAHNFPTASYVELTRVLDLWADNQQDAYNQGIEASVQALQAKIPPLNWGDLELAKKQAIYADAAQTVLALK